MTAHEHSREGFKDRTPLATAVSRFRELVDSHDRTEEVPLAGAAGRVAVTDIHAPRAVPHYDRAAMDGWAVRAAATVGASNRAPVTLKVGESVGPDTAVRVHTGSALPADANAVVMVEDVDVRDNQLEVFAPAAVGENVGERGEDVEANELVCSSGERLRPSDLALLRSLGLQTVTVASRPDIAVIPTGEELVDADPGPGQVIETNGLTVSTLVDRWGGVARYRSVIDDDPDALRSAISSDIDADLIVTTGGSSVGDRDLLPDLIDELGDLVVHGVALKPGHPVGIGLIESVPIVLLPGYPVACLVNAVQFVRPAVSWLQGVSPPAHPRVEATLDGKLRSAPGERTFARVALSGRADDSDDVRAAPVRVSGAGVLSSVTRADGWVVVPEPVEGYDQGTSVSVELWEWSP